MTADQLADKRRERCFELTQMKYQLADQIKNCNEEKAAVLLRRDYREVIDELNLLEQQYYYDNER